METIISKANIQSFIHATEELYWRVIEGDRREESVSGVPELEACHVISSSCW